MSWVGNDGQQVDNAGYAMDTEGLATLSPYQTEHINRFGTYILNLQRIPPPLDYEFWKLGQ
jgi:Tn3 transposase DDE domain